MRSYIPLLLAGTLALASPAFADESTIDQEAVANPLTNPTYVPNADEIAMDEQMTLLSDARGLAKAVREYSGSEMTQGEHYLEYRWGDLGKLTLTDVPNDGYQIGVGSVELNYTDNGQIGISDDDWLDYKVTGIDMTTGKPFALELTEGLESGIVLRITYNESGSADFSEFDNPRFMEKVREEAARTLADLLTR
jgi:hypothetical protein